MLVFLDIDGVMVPAAGWKAPENLEDGFPLFSQKATDALKSLISPDTKVILTSSHKSRFTIDQWKSIFEKRGIHLENLSRLEQNHNSLRRKEEIENWFNGQTIDEDFIIIDDDKSLYALPSYLKDRLIVTSPLVGLTWEHIALAKKILASN